ncbi:MAG: hypothetical protein J6I76_09655 [Oribacterium sp.]|nr:hypothetical protein [Oribacterium sp.]
MEIRLPKEYLIREDNGYMPIYIIKPPKDVEELVGYILKMPQKNVEILTDSIVLCNGNEWDKNLREYTIDSDLIQITRPVPMVIK